MNDEEGSQFTTGSDGKWYITEWLPAGEEDREFALNILEACGFAETLQDGNRTLLLEPDVPVAELVNTARRIQGNALTYSASATIVADTDDGALGEPSCLYSAKSPHLRCAINPHGPCEGCGDFEDL